ncbi:Sm domain-containing protein [Aphelenchoides fujianensis]|nr:Sm domain-containing protein [Aphelenchoides fujianensis]
MTIGKNNKLMSQLNHRLKIVLQDGRTFVGYFKAFDKHMNIIVSECEEHRRIKAKPGKKLVNEEEKRVLGLVLIRGDKIISMSVDGPPQKEDEIKLPKAGGLGGPGTAKPGVRGVPIVPPQMPGAPAGLAGPVAGMGGAGMPAMQPGYPMGGPPRPF